MLSRVLSEIGNPISYTGSAYRIVETQEYAATTALVNNLDEQALLEEMLDSVKPPYQENTQQLHYLISTPFRYPPLKYGSRFGSVVMPSYFYASEDMKTMLSECAYYRFIFLDDMTIPYEKPINSEHMSFSVKIKSEAMADLTLVTSSDIIETLMSLYNYQFSQSLGRTLTLEGDFDMLRYYSARNRCKSANIALTTPDLIVSKQPEECINWICQTTANKISFSSYGVKPISYAIEYFLVDGRLPRPA